MSTNVWTPSITGDSTFTVTDNVVDPFEGQTLTAGPMRIVQAVAADGTSTLDAPLLTGWGKTAVTNNIQMVRDTEPTTVSPQDVADSITATSLSTAALPSAFDVTVGSYNYESYPGITSETATIIFVAPSPSMDGTLFAVERDGLTISVLIKAAGAVTWTLLHTESGWDNSSVSWIQPVNNTAVIMHHVPFEATLTYSAVRSGSEEVLAYVRTPATTITPASLYGAVNGHFFAIYENNIAEHVFFAYTIGAASSTKLGEFNVEEPRLPVSSNIAVASNAERAYFIDVSVGSVYTIEAAAFQGGMNLAALIARTPPTLGTIDSVSYLFYGGLANDVLYLVGGLDGTDARVVKMTGDNFFTTDVIAKTGLGAAPNNVHASPLSADELTWALQIGGAAPIIVDINPTTKVFTASTSVIGTLPTGGTLVSGSYFGLGSFQTGATAEEGALIWRGLRPKTLTVASSASLVTATATGTPTPTPAKKKKKKNLALIIGLSVAAFAILVALITLAWLKHNDKL
jgi:hypothetical protein